MTDTSTLSVEERLAWLEVKAGIAMQVVEKLPLLADALLRETGRAGQAEHELRVGLTALTATVLADRPDQAANVERLIDGMIGERQTSERMKLFQAVVKALTGEKDVAAVERSLKLVWSQDMPDENESTS